MTWVEFDSGASIGTEGSEAGTIVADYEHQHGARITIERDGETAPFAITCGIYGWFVHTRFFSTREEADNACTAMQSALDSIIQSIPPISDPEHESRSAGVVDRISDFMATFP